ncbi:MAG: hypothetical protein KJ676_08140 [Alphaproteobacteria bacterium]|nr:hypothetical protein [Alphaproteobacteria bacterium]MBU1526145.1 hypothetical protein [Alphaproteobacteria bacterium]MBU2116762.1 hypothetical protein [Alphaproteobacteria bacterium]MBU2350218.1 hypothetical protein [Alphaproteobacteria bacterium]MBU2381412.1 hypothetical protein [Alphaproteobacteria bacterium]
MRKIAFLASLVAAAAVAGVAQAQTVNVEIGGELRREALDLGPRDVRRQADRLAEVVHAALVRQGGFEGATVNLVLLDVRPNRPTFQQLADSPGLDGHRSVSTGGAEITGEIVLADGTVRPLPRWDWYSHSISEVMGFGTWQDAERAYSRYATALISGRLL